MKFITTGATDTGPRRERNEDAFLIDEKAGLAAVADGVGGGLAGDVASRLALDVLHRELSSLGTPDPAAMLKAIHAASDVVTRMGQRDARLRGMATTLTALWMGAEHGVVGHVGDTRLYRMRGHRCEQITRDDTVLQILLNAGLVSDIDALTHPSSHVLTQSVGSGPLNVHVSTLELSVGDHYILCSDGARAPLDDANELAFVLADPDASAAQRIVARAGEVDGRDNATAVVVTCREGDPVVEPRGWAKLRARMRRARPAA